MRELASIIGGIGLLIFAYLLIAHAPATVQIAQGFTAAGVNTISVLQGNTPQVQFPQAA